MADEHLMNLLTEAEQALAAIALPPADGLPPGVRTYRWDQLHEHPASTHTAGPDRLPQAAVTLRIELGRTRLRPRELLALRKGSVIPLDRTAGDAVDIYADGRLAARGEVVVRDGNFGVRVVEVLAEAEGK